MKIALVGTGVIGTSLGLLLQRAGHTIVAVVGRTKRRTQAAATLLGGVEVLADPGLAALGADVVLLAVPDREIAAVARQIVAGGALKRGAIVAHLAGGLEASVLEPVRAVGAHAGALHPLQTFADVDTALRMLPGTIFALEGDPPALDTLASLATCIGGRPLRLAPGHKALYHAGAVAASNFVVTLIDYAVHLLVRAGVPAAEALPALLPLLKGTVHNLEKLGLPAALTGPIARGDVGTVEAHLTALAAAPDDMLRVYVALARKNVELALRKGTLASQDAQRILSWLEHHERGDPG